MFQSEIGIIFYSSLALNISGRLLLFFHVLLMPALTAHSLRNRTENPVRLNKKKRCAKMAKAEGGYNTQ